MVSDTANLISQPRDLGHFFYRSALLRIPQDPECGIVVSIAPSLSHNVLKLQQSVTSMSEVCCLSNRGILYGDIGLSSFECMRLNSLATLFEVHFGRALMIP